MVENERKQPIQTERKKKEREKYTDKVITWERDKRDRERERIK